MRLYNNLSRILEKMGVKGCTIWLHDAFTIFDVILPQPGLTLLSRWIPIFISSSWVLDNNNDGKWRPPGTYLVQGYEEFYSPDLVQYLQKN